MMDLGLAVTRAELRGPVVNGVLCSWVKETCHSSGHCPRHILDAQSNALTQWALQWSWVSLVLQGLKSYGQGAGDKANPFTSDETLAFLSKCSRFFCRT